MKTNEMICFAHRGACGYEPENTLRAFRKALDLGAKWIELDVYPIENELVIIHDLRLERTTNGSGFIWKHNLDYLRSLDAGKGEKIPLLSEVFDLMSPEIGINIELKWHGSAELVARFLQHHFSSNELKSERFLVSSFIHAELLTFRKLMPEIRIGALTGDLPLELALFAEKLGAYSVNPTIEFINRDFVHDAHRRGLKVFVYTVNHFEEFSWMRELGVDGVFSDFPDRILKWGLLQQ
ncbi:MAG: glycerophosphodiester phosphodiesterase family protein [Candidatus Electryonea clarkiae]|nr:glycerophosphodiester phosphodiesterase family protein [Candidatus Electryonea clarkiae]